MSGCAGSADVVFVLDTSSAVDYHDFQPVKSFLSELVSQLAVDSGQIRVGLVTYANTVEERFNLTRYSSRDDLRSAISTLSYSNPGGHSTGTAGAIAYVRQVTIIIDLFSVTFCVYTSLLPYLRGE